MSLRSVCYWMNEASGTFRSTRNPLPYGGPRKAAVLLMDSTLVMLDLTNRQACYDLLRDITCEQVVGTFLAGASRRSGWCGEAEVVNALGGTSTLTTDEHADLDDAVEDLKAQRAEALVEAAEILADPAKELEYRLKAHDWWYAYSDDHSVWSSGEATRRRLHALCDRLGSERAKPIWNANAPQDFQIAD